MDVPPLTSDHPPDSPSSPWPSYLLPTLLFLIASLLSYGKMKWFDRTARLLAKFPCITPLPLLGSAWMLLKNPRPEGGTEVVSYAVNKKGRRSVFWMGNIPYVILGDTDSFQKTLSSGHLVEKGRDYENLKWLFGEGLITSAHNLWSRDKKILTPSFKFQKLRGFIPIFNKNSRKLMEILQNYENKEHDLHPLLCRAMMDSTTKAVFGRETNFQEDLESEFMKAVYMALDLMRTKVIRPYLCLPVIEYLSGVAQREKFCMSIFQGYVEEAKRGRLEIIKNKANNNDKKRALEGDSDSEEEDDSPFIDVLLAPENQYPDLDIKGHIITIFSAGFETTSTCLNFTLFMLAHNPEAQKKLQAEQDSIFASDPDRDVTFNDLADMKYMEMCIKETLRILPSVPCFFRRIKEDVKLDDDLTIPAGVDIFFSLFELHRDPANFPDPLKFDPDRFLPELCAERSPWSYIPWAIGQRSCAGFRYAMLIVKTTLSYMFRKYTVRTTLRIEDMKLWFGVVLEPSPHFKFVLIPRGTEKKEHSCRNCCDGDDDEMDLLRGNY